MPIQFTRYLYSKDQVVDSFRKALIERRKDAALFWVYELYFSGFVEEAWTTVNEMYALYWETVNPRLRKHLEDRTKGGDARIGSMVLTLCIREPNLREPNLREPNLREPNLREPNLRDPSSQQNNEKFVFTLSEKALSAYKTVDPTSCKYKYRYLERVTTHAVSNTEQNLDLNTAFLGGNWTKYCMETPYWRTILDSFQILEDLLQNKVDEDQMEQFYEMYGYEPEEQTVEVERAHGVFL